MAELQEFEVRLSSGLKGTVLRTSRFLDKREFNTVKFSNGTEITVPSATLALLSNEGTVTYAVTERAGAWASWSLGTEKALGFAQHVMSGLQYLHTRNLVYCVLSPHTVVPVGTNWKLSDFRQLRVAGTDTSDEALSLAATLDTCPPEAAEGLISPAWDVWSFGQTLRKVLTGYKAHMPDPFRAVFLACLNVNPSSRPTLNQLSGLLETTRLSSREPGISTAATA
jgi:serine/threonine protein kinase